MLKGYASSHTDRWLRYARPLIVGALAGGELLIPQGGSLAQEQPSRTGDTAIVEPEDSPLGRGGWRFSALARTSLTFTDNAYLTPSNKTADFVLSPGAVLGAHQTRASSVFDALLEVDYDIYRKASDMNGPRINALLDGTMRFSDDTWSVRARTATNLQPSSYLGLVPATARTIGGNQVQVLSYGLSPAFHQAVSDTMRVEASYDLAGVMFVRAPAGSTDVAASNALMHRAQAGLASRGAGAPLVWSLTGSYEQQDLAESGPSSRHGGGEANGEYHVTPKYALLAKGGYEWFDQPTLNDKLTGIYGTGGILYRPTPRSSLRLEAGYRYREPNYAGELEFGPSQRLVVVAGFNQGVDTSQGAVNGVFARAMRDAEGNLVDPLTGLPPTSISSPFDLNNQAFRYSRARLGLRGVLGRTYYNASATYEWRDANGINGDSWAAQMVLGRNLTRNLSATVEARYAKTTSPALLVDGPRSETSTGTASLNYQLSKGLVGSLRYVHLRQSTTLVNYRENAAVLTLVKSF